MGRRLARFAVQASWGATSSFPYWSVAARDRFADLGSVVDLDANTTSFYARLRL